MVVNLSKIKTEALLLFCKDIISSYKDENSEDTLNNKDIKEYMDEISSDIYKQLDNILRPNQFYIDNQNSYRVKAVLKSYNFLNKQLSKEFKEGMKFNPSMLYFSMLTVWFKELNKELKSKEYIYFLLYPYYKVYDKMLLNIEDEDFKNMNIEMIKIAEKVIMSFDKISLQ